MTALAMSSALRHCNDSKGALGQRAPQKAPHEILPLLPIHNEVRQCHWGTSRRCKQAGNTQSIKNLTKDVSGADNSSIAVNNLTAGTVILPGQAPPSLSGIPTGNPVPPARQHFCLCWHLCLSRLLGNEEVTAGKMAELTDTYLQKHRNKRKNVRSWKPNPNENLHSVQIPEQNLRFEG